LPKQDGEGRRVGNSMEKRLVEAVRNSLNLPRLRVRARHSARRDCWLVRLEQGRSCSDWLELNSPAVAVVRKVGLLPPKKLGLFRLAYAALYNRKSGVKSKESS
jgi:hypothetical protein